MALQHPPMKQVLILLLLLHVMAASAGVVKPLEQILGPALATEINECFKSAYSDPQIYTAFWCNRNSKNLYQKCFSPKKVEGHIMYLLSVDKDEDIAADKPMQLIFPLMSRAQVGEWSFHVLLESHGHIFDLDYGTTPTTPNILEYFKKMFDVAEKNDRKLVVRVISAAEYAQNYDEYGRKNWTYYIFNDDGFFPLQDVVIYLKNFESGEMSEALDHLAVQ